MWNPLCCKHAVFALFHVFSLGIYVEGVALGSVVKYDDIFKLSRSQ